MERVLKVLGIIMIVFSFSTTVQSQSSNEQLEVERLAKQMFVDINNRDYEAIMDMSHPKIFEIAPREAIIDVFKGMLEGNDEFKITLPDTIPAYKVSKVLEISDSNSKLAFVSYSLNMNMTFKGQSFDSEMKETMKNMMSAQGMDVTFISDSSLDVVIPNSLTLLLKEESTDNKWVMVNYDPDSPLFYQVLSKELIEEARAYKQNLMLESSKN